MLVRPFPDTPPRTVIFDADSTLAGIEGIDWLAALRGVAVAERVAAATAEAMNGRIGLEEVYSARLNHIRPTRDEIASLGAAYVIAVAPGAKELITELHAKGVRTPIVSAGIRSALLELAAHLGVPVNDVHGVELFHDANGDYRDFDRTTPLTQTMGKPTLVRTLRLPGRIVAVGDGMSDLEIAEDDPTIEFIAYRGFVARPNVLHRSTQQVSSFKQLRQRLYLEA